MIGENMAAPAPMLPGPPVHVVGLGRRLEVVMPGGGGVLEGFSVDESDPVVSVVKHWTWAESLLLTEPVLVSLAEVYEMGA